VAQACWLDGKADLTRFSFCFDRVFVERESSISGYHVAIFSTKNLATWRVQNAIVPPVANLPIPDIVPWQPRDARTTCATIDGLNLDDRPDYQLVVRARNMHGLYSDIAVYAFGVDTQGPPIAAGVVDFAAAVQTMQDGRVARGLGRYGYLADRTIPLTLPPTLNGTSLPVATAVDGGYNSGALLKPLVLPVNFTWHPLLTINTPYNAPAATVNGGGVCVLSSRPLEIPGFSGLLPVLGGRYSTPARDTIRGGVTKVAPHPSAFGNHTTLCGPGAYRTDFGVCAKCPAGMYKADVGDGACLRCGRGTFAFTLAQQTGSSRGAGALYSLAASTPEDAQGATHCACLDYTTQEFDAASGECVCKGGFAAPFSFIGKAGDLAGQVEPKAPDGAVAAIVESGEGICKPCEAGTAKRSGNTACSTCPDGTVATENLDDCVCSDSLRVYLESSGKCECKPGLMYDDVTDSCVRCPGPLQAKAIAGNDAGLCKRCPAGSRPDAETGSICVPTVPRAVPDAAGPGTGPGCPVGTVHRFRGYKPVRVSGALWTYYDPFLQAPDIYRPDGRVCVDPMDDQLTGSLRLEVRSYVKGAFAATAAAAASGGALRPPVVPTQVLLDPADKTVFAQGEFWLLSPGTKKRVGKADIYTPSPEALRFVREQLQGPASLTATVARKYMRMTQTTTNYDYTYHSTLWDETIMVRNRSTAAMYETLIPHVDWRAAAKAGEDAWEFDVVPALRLARTTYLAYAQMYVNYTNQKNSKLGANVPDTDKRAMVLMQGVHDYHLSDLWALYYESWTSFKGLVESVSGVMDPFTGVVPNQASGFWRLTFPGPDSACSFVRQVPVHDCEKCPEFTFWPYPTPISDATLADQRNSDRRVNDGACLPCPSGSSSPEAVMEGQFNFFAAGAVDRLILDWRNIFMADARVGGVTYAYALGTSPGGTQVMDLTEVGNATSVLVEGPASRLGLQPGVPIFATVVATDMLGNPTRFSDTNPVVFDAVGPVAGAAKDATLDDYVPPEVAAAIAEAAANNQGSQQQQTTTHSARRARALAARASLVERVHPTSGRTLGVTTHEVKEKLNAEEEAKRMMLVAGARHERASRRSLARFHTAVLTDADGDAELRAEVEAYVTEARSTATRRAREQEQNGHGVARGVLMRARALSRAMDRLSARKMMATANVADVNVVKRRSIVGGALEVPDAAVEVSAASASSASPAIMEDQQVAVDASARLLQYGSMDADLIGAGASYNWRLDSSLMDITFVSDKAFQTTCDTMSITFEAFSGAITGVTEMLACIGSAPGWCDLSAPQPIKDVDPAALSSGLTGTATTVVLGGLTLTPGAVAYGTVFALSGAGQVATVSTNGVLCEDRPPSADNAVVFDTGRYHAASPTIPGSGRSGKGGFLAYDVDCDVAGVGLGASWSGFEFFLPPARFEWAVGTSPGMDDVQAWTSVGVVTSAYNETANVEAGTTVYTSVRAVDIAGRSAMAVSDGLLLLAGTGPDGGVGPAMVCQGSPADMAGLGVTVSDADRTGIAGLAVVLEGVEEVASAKN